VSQGAAAQGAFVAPAIARTTKRRPELVAVVCGGDHVLAIMCSRHAIVVQPGKEAAPDKFSEVI
jgi:hypothetical protein